MTSEPGAGAARAAVRRARGPRVPRARCCSTCGRSCPGSASGTRASSRPSAPRSASPTPRAIPATRCCCGWPRWCCQPFGEPALRANLLSALLVSGAAALTAVAVVQVTRRPVIGLAAGALLAVAPIAWENAVRADPHAFHLFLGALLLVLLLAWASRERAGRAGAGPLAGRRRGRLRHLARQPRPDAAAWRRGWCCSCSAVAPRILWQRWRLVLACLVAVVVDDRGRLRLPAHPLGDGPAARLRPPGGLDPHRCPWRVTGGFRYLVLGEQFRGTFHEWPTRPGGGRPGVGRHRRPAGRRRPARRPRACWRGSCAGRG